MTCKQKYKIEKKVREHNRKLRKGTLKNNKHRRKSKKDPGVPNLAPFKQKILDEVDQLKKKAALLKEQRRQEIRAKRKGADATAATVSEDQAEAEPEIGSNPVSDGSTKAFYKEFRKVVEQADVIIQVLDARDPLGSRSSQLEKTVMNAEGNKKLVLLLNKSDLVPKQNLRDWVRYLRGEWPTLAFKSSTQRQSRSLCQSSLGPVEANERLLQSQQCLGAGALIQLLANYGGARGQEPGSGVTVGVVGKPNVGKSSVINSLKRGRACCVGGVAGVTRHMQCVRLDSRVLLLDSPGVVLDGAGEQPLEAAEKLIARLDSTQLQLFYRVPAFSDAAHFLALLARRQGKLKTGGRVDVDAAAVAVNHDWSSGRIPYHTQPPVQELPRVVTTTDTVDVDSEPKALPRKIPVIVEPESQAQNTQVLVNLESTKRGHEDTEQPEASTDTTSTQKRYKQMMKKRRKLQSRNARRVDELSEQINAL